MITIQDFTKNRMSTPHLIKRNYDWAKTYINHIKGQGYDLNVIFDIGANVGVFTRSFIDLVPNATVYSFEPVKPTFEVLQKNNQIWKNKAKIFNFGFWKAEAELELGYPEHRDDYDNTGLYSVFGTKKKIKAKFKVLDDWCEKNNIWPDYIKIDAEGSELNILNNGIKALQKCHTITVEEYQGSKKGVLDNIMKNNGFQFVKKISKMDKFWIKPVA